jgi:monoterpene epsilon-lactone hydrolase
MTALLDHTSMNDQSPDHAFANPWTTIRPLTAHDQPVMTKMRADAAPHKGKLRGVAARSAFDGIISQTAAAEGVGYRKDRIGGVSGWWCEPSAAPGDAAILHLHGGWFNWGSADAYRHLVGHIARRAGARVFVPDYRLAPEHPFPAGAHDARACIEGLLDLNLRAVAVTGDSAGGNLALTLLPTHGPRLVAAVVFSPVTDLTLSGGSWSTRAEADPFFLPDQVETLVDAYLAGHDPTDPLASPLFGGFVGVPPLRVHVGNDEALRDDSLRYVERAVASGADAAVEVWEGMVHGFVGHAGHLEAADAALESAGAFLAVRLATGPQH